MKYLKKIALFAPVIIPDKYQELENIIEQISNRHCMTMEQFLSSYGMKFLQYIQALYDRYHKTKDDGILNQLVQCIEKEIKTL